MSESPYTWNRWSVGPVFNVRETALGVEVWHDGDDVHTVFSNEDARGKAWLAAARLADEQIMSCPNGNTDLVKVSNAPRC